MILKRFFTFLIFSLSILLTTACTGQISGQSHADEPDHPEANLANPAAVYCSGLGYRMENVTRNGGEDADCIFSDGSRCAQWEFLSGGCGQEFTYCVLQGYSLEGGNNIGTCIFPDGSSCDEFLFFTGDCSPGDNIPGIGEEEPVQIQDLVDARDFIAAYFSEQYGIKGTEPWIEQDVTPQDAIGSSTIRFVSGPLTIIIFTEAAAPSPSEYIIQEASYITNGFYWEGILTFEGDITETKVHIPGSILNEEDARDGVLEFLVTNYGLIAPGEWIDQGLTAVESVVRMKRIYTSESYVVTIEFEPSAPLVSTYYVTVDNLTENVRWEGEITLQGDISEINFSQGE
jgi:putative hemolysin